MKKTPHSGTPPQSETNGVDVETLVREHQVGLWRYLRALGCEASIAEDLVQDTFVAVLKHDVQDLGQAAMAGYLRTVARNHFISRMRREKRVQAVEEIELIDECWQQWVGDETGDALLDALRGCFARLTDRAKQALEMRFRDRSSRGEIAAALEVTEHGAKNLMQRAKQQLKACIESQIK